MKPGEANCKPKTWMTGPLQAAIWRRHSVADPGFAKGGVDLGVAEF